MLIDALGDMDALQHACAEFLGLDKGEPLQPATLMFRFGPIDFARFDTLSKAELTMLALRGHGKGRLAREALHASRDRFSDDGCFNISRLGINASDALALGAAGIKGRRQAWSAAQYCANACRAASAGSYVLSAPRSGFARPGASGATSSSRQRPSDGLRARAG